MSNRPSTLQLETLVEFLEQNPGIARGFLRTSQGKQESKQKWAEIAVTLNALGGVIKDGPGWSKYWAEKKCSLKKLHSQHAASIRRTGGGEGERCSLSQLDKRLVAVMGGTSFASGDSELAVNPFPQMERIKESPQSRETIGHGSIETSSPRADSPESCSYSLSGADAFPPPKRQRRPREFVNANACELYGQLLAEKLKALGTDDRLVLMNEIDNLVFKYTMNARQLQHELGMKTE